jgi:hypothetical protein
MRASVRATGKRPREAFGETMASLPKRFQTSEIYEDVVAILPSYNEVRRQLCRHRSNRCTPVPDPLVIPDELTYTLRGREAAEDDLFYHERFLLYSGQEGKIQIFCAASELAVLHQSEYFICDGTFEMAPDSTSQLYTIHGFNKGEAMALCWALLRSKTKATYVEMLTALRSAIVAQCGNVGAVR